MMESDPECNLNKRQKNPRKLGGINESLQVPGDKTVSSCSIMPSAELPNFQALPSQVLFRPNPQASSINPTNEVNVQYDMLFFLLFFF